MLFATPALFAANAFVVISDGLEARAEVLGVGWTSDAYHFTKPNPETIKRGIREALADAGIAPGDIGYINAHGTSTQKGDLVEIECLRAVFGKALEKKLPLAEMIEQIDIGGPTLLRASAKNFNSILVVPDPAFYPEIMDALAQNAMQAPLPLRQKTAAATFRATSTYDDAIATYLANA